ARSVTTGALPRLTGKRPNVAVVTTEGAGAGRRRAWGSRRGPALRAAHDWRRSLQAPPARPRGYPPEAGARNPARRARPPRAYRPPSLPALGRGATAECRRLLANVRLGAATPYDQRSRPRASPDRHRAGGLPDRRRARRPRPRPLRRAARAVLTRAHAPRAPFARAGAHARAGRRPRRRAVRRLGTRPSQHLSGARAWRAPRLGRSCARRA